MNITPVQSDSEWQDARRIREQVFIDEQDCPPEEEWDGHDETSRHVLGWVDGKAVATARWRAVPYDGEVVAKLERFAVLPDYRRQGHGTHLVERVVEDARRAGFDTFLVHAQAHLEAWYADLGFRSTGHTFEEVGIPHVEMVRQEPTEKAAPQRENAAGPDSESAA
jgi:predicted GNAT family N-acyltransferase